MNEIAVLKIKSYVDEFLFEPQFTWPKCEFNERSYSRWAAFEIMHRLMDRPYEQPTLIVEEFIFEVDLFSHMIRTKNDNRVFAVAKNTAEDILRLL